MRIPRIPFHARPFVFRFRRAEVGFKEFHLTRQTDQIRSLQGALRISPIGMYMFSQVAGRRIVEPIKWILGECLDDIIRGYLRTEHPEQQDLLASTFGETLGAMMTCWRLGGNLRIVRLLEDSDSKSPDYILLRETRGQVEQAHLLECKGAVEDLNNIKKIRKFDICKHVRTFRSKGYKQLKETKLGETIGHELSVSNPKKAIKVPGFTRNLAVTIVPDSRILQESNSVSIRVGRESCRNGKRNQCFQCIRVDPETSRFVYVHHQEEIKGSLKASREDKKSMVAIRKFVRRYESAWRALWAENDDDFKRQLIHLHKTTTDSRSKGPLLDYTNEMLCRLADAANQADLEIETAIDEVAKNVKPPYRKRLENISHQAKSKKTLHIDYSYPSSRCWRKQLGAVAAGQQGRRLSVQSVIFNGRDGKIIKLTASGDPRYFDDHLEHAVADLIHSEGVQEDIHWEDETVDFFDHDESDIEYRDIPPAFSYSIGKSWTSSRAHPDGSFSRAAAWIGNNGIAEIFIPHFKETDQ